MTEEVKLGITYILIGAAIICAILAVIKIIQLIICCIKSLKNKENDPWASAGLVFVGSLILQFINIFTNKHLDNPFILLLVIIGIWIIPSSIWGIWYLHKSIKEDEDKEQEKSE